MAANIGGVSCTFVRGGFPVLKYRTRRWAVPGIDGHGLMVMGRGNSSCELIAVFYSNNTGVNTWAAALEALQGTIVSAENDQGDTTSDLFVEQVKNAEKKAAKNGAITTRAEIRILGTIIA